MRILCFGDSNTYGFDPRSYFGGRYESSERWMDILAERCGVECVNLGENGRGIPRRGTAPGLGEYDRGIVMLGTNELLQGLDAEECAGHMERFLARSWPERRRVLLISPPPLVRGAWVSDSELIDESRRLAAAYREVAASLSQYFADAGDWGVELAFDGVHFTPEGHRAFALGAAEAVKSAFLKQGEV